MIYLLPHSITQSALQFPERPAFSCGAHVLTYRQMENRMNQLAGLLYQQGIRKGDRVGIYLNRSIETAIAIYGIMQAGAVYVPIDPKAPIERSQFLIEECGVEILISNPTQKRNLEKIIESQAALKTIIGINETSWSVSTIDWQEVYNCSVDFVRPFSLLEKDLAYIIYTSGSTGKPKGIMHTHYSGLSYARLSANTYNITAQDRIGNHAPIHFDISTLGYFTGPLVGACTVICSDAHTIFPASLGQLIEKEKISIWYSVPLALIQMLQNGILDDKAMPDLRWVLYGGEPFPTKYLKTLMEQWSQTQFSNVYGPAEVNQCTYYHLPSIPENDDPIPIGTIWGNTEYLIVDDSGNTVPSGETGELLVRSATQMSGYWNNPKLTNDSLFRRRLPSGEEHLFYKTGDLVMEDTDGLMHFLGRKDFQVKIRGYRVELDSVEACLVAHDAVSEAAVYPVRISEESRQIEAAVILKPTANIGTKELLNFLKSKLPFYAVPEKIKLVDDFPRTTSGKIKRTALATIS